MTPDERKTIDFLTVTFKEGFAAGWEAAQDAKPEVPSFIVKVDGKVDAADFEAKLKRALRDMKRQGWL